MRKSIDVWRSDLAFDSLSLLKYAEERHAALFEKHSEKKRVEIHSELSRSRQFILFRFLSAKNRQQHIDINSLSSNAAHVIDTLS